MAYSSLVPEELQKLHEYGTRLKLGSYKTLSFTLVIIDSKGLHTCPSNAEVITRAPKPTNNKKLSLGLIAGSFL